MTLLAWLFLSLLAVFFIAFVMSLSSLIIQREYVATLERRLEDSKERHQRATRRIAETVQGITDVVLAITPVIEQTDWMTGRWHGNFAGLQAAERRRNAAVVDVRRAMTRIPLVRDAANRNKVDIFKAVSASVSPGWAWGQ